MFSPATSEATRASNTRSKEGGGVDVVKEEEEDEVEVLSVCARGVE